uniref:Putative ovule protein n=1 Tax=Solanum chacoense TaxID=4108 RepID=A0A0V0GMJ4_SOLCH
MLGFFLCRMQLVVLDMHKDADMFSKASKNGEYSVNSFYRLLQESSAENVASWTWMMIWKTLSPLKVACFSW